jgi:hypothetical protein
MANDRYLIDALELENAALRARVAELVRLLSAAQDACDKAEAERKTRVTKLKLNGGWPSRTCYSASLPSLSRLSLEQDPPQLQDCLRPKAIVFPER